MRGRITISAMRCRSSIAMTRLPDISRSARSIRDYPEAHNNLGNALQSLDRTDDAIDITGKPLALRPNYPERLTIWRARSRCSNRHEEAIENCTEALVLSPNNPEAHLNLANSLGAMGQPEEALAHYQKALAIDPAQYRAYARTAFMLFHLGRIGEAIAYCEQALSIEPDHVDALLQFGRRAARFGPGRRGDWLGSKKRLPLRPATLPVFITFSQPPGGCPRPTRILRPCSTWPGRCKR